MNRFSLRLHIFTTILIVFSSALFTPLHALRLINALAIPSIAQGVRQLAAANKAERVQEAESRQKAFEEQFKTHVREALEKYGVQDDPLITFHTDEEISEANAYIAKTTPFLQRPHIKVRSSMQQNNRSQWKFTAYHEAAHVACKHNDNYAIIMTLPLLVISYAAATKITPLLARRISPIAAHSFQPVVQAIIGMGLLYTGNPIWGFYLRLDEHQADVLAAHAIRCYACLREVADSSRHETFSKQQARELYEMGTLTSKQYRKVLNGYLSEDEVLKIAQQYKGQYCKDHQH